MSSAARAAAGSACNRAARGQLVSHGVKEALAQMQLDMDAIADWSAPTNVQDIDRTPKQWWRSKEAA